MPIEGMYWDTNVRAMDVHVLAGTTSTDLSAGLVQFMRRDATNDPEYPYAKEHMTAHPGDVTLKFTIADAAKKPGESTRTFTGITLNAATGEVTVVPVAQLPARFVRNFVVEVTAKSGPGEPFKQMIRVHVHKSIQRIWLTPGTLKVRQRRSAAFPQSTPIRFGLRARFDDDTVGDITDWDAVEWSSKRGAAATSNVESGSGTLKIAAGDAAATDVTVSARITTLPALGSATATLRVLEPWKPEAPIEARLVPGAGKPETKKNPQELIAFALDAVPNVLFLPDGFPASEKDAFYKYVNSVVTFIKNNSLCKPYDVLAESINFWAAFIPSDQQGITWGSELFAVGTAPDLTVKAVPRPNRPLEPPLKESWELEDLIYEVGLAMPSDRPENAARTDGAIMADWDALFGNDYRNHLPEGDELDALLVEWRSLGRRRLLDDIDTPLGMVSGAPRADVYHDTISLNPDRMDRGRLDDLMGALRHDKAASSGLRLDNLWTDARKRNYDLVCLVTLGQGRELNDAGFFTLSQQPSKDVQRCTLTGVNDIVPAALLVQTTSPPSQSLVFAHELCHSFDLGDEYGGHNDRPLFPVEAEHSHRNYGNIQSDSTVKVAGKVTGEEIKWRWPRIRWAVELIGPVTDAGGGVFTAPIRMSHAFAAPIGELVHFRFRDIHFAYRDLATDAVHYDDESAYLVKNPRVSVPLKLVELFETGSPPIKNIRVKVEAGAGFPHPPDRTVEPDQIVANFRAGCILYCPTKAPAGVYNAASYPYAELIAKNVMEHVTFLHAPIGKTNDDLSIPENPALMSMPVPSWFDNGSLPLIVGLYEGGMGNMTGVFHPTGNCKMTAHDGGARFCQVCRYVLVDAINPSRHYFIDPEYTEIYPQR